MDKAQQNAAREFRLIAAERATRDLTILCRCLEMTRSGFYAWHYPPRVAAREGRSVQLNLSDEPQRRRN
jgi:hypothetical protein